MALRAFRRRDEPLEDHSVLVIAISDLNVDKDYQRDLDVARGDRYAKEWDPYLLNELTVAEREDGSYWVIDGAHRLHAAKKRGIENLRCFVVRGLTREQEADLFVRLNKNRRPVNAWDSFRAALTAKDPAALRIKAVVEECGFTIGRWNGPRVIKAVAGLQRVHRLGGTDLLKEALTTIATVWDGDKDASDSFTVVGVSTFLHHYRSHSAFRMDRLIDVLTPLPVARLMREATAMGTERAGFITTNTGAVRAALVIRGHYNRNLRTRKLPLPVDSRGRTIGAYSE